MNVTTVSTGTGTTTQHTTTTTLNSKTYKIEMIDDGQSMCSDDEDDDIISTDGSMYGDGDLAQMAVQDDVANQLAAAGPVGVAAAAAIASSKKRKRAHSFETNPSVRKRQQNRLLRKLRGIIYEFTGRVGKQAVVLVATPGKPNTSYKVFGAKPLEDVVRNLKNIVMEELESALAQQAPPPPQEDPSLFELPPLIIDGIPTPVEKMTQAQLRAFIPLMLKYSTGRGKPGWGRESTRPPWWPKELPWANVRMDARSEDDKQKVRISWTHALRKIVINCYKYHGREDLLPTFADDDDKINQLISQTGEDDDDEEPMTTTITQQVTNAATNTTHNYTQTVLSQNADGTVSLIQVDPNNPIITLPDGTTAQVQGVATLHQGEGGATIQAVQSLGDVNGHENMTVDLTEVGQDGQIYITAEDGQGYPVTSMITVPVTSAMYNSMIANIQQIHTNSDGTVCITPMQVDSHNNNNNHIQCYSIMAATAPGSGSRLLAASSPTMPPSANQNQTNVPNNNNNNNSSSSSSSSRSNISCNNQTRCQIFNQSSLSNNSSQPLHQRQQQNQQQLQQNQSQMQPATTRVIIAGNLHANPLNFNVNTNTNLGTNINNNNNNNIIINNNNHNNKIGGIASAVPLPIVLTTGSPAALVANASITKRTSTHKRRKQNFSKTVPIKLENRATSESLLNIHIVDSHDHANVDGGSRNQGRVGGSSDIVSTVDAAGGGGSDISLPTKTIKLENVKK